MQGFDPKFETPEDYILGITKEIWEDRGLSTLRAYYGDNIVVRAPASVVVGNEDVIAATAATLAEFPDRELLGEDVIWCEDGGGGGGFLSSHRILSTATHTGDGAYGSATGRSLRYRIIADCHAANNVIDDEWIIRDQGAIVRQMGFEPKAWAAERMAAAGAPPAPLTPERDRPGPYLGQGNDHSLGTRYAEILSAIMSADMASIPNVYDRAVELALPGGVTGYGWGAADRFFMGLRAAFPSAEFAIHHRIGREDPSMPPRAALRWSLWGRHDGFGAFGPPTGAMVYVMGLSHAEFGPRGLRREWILYDETAIWTQILAHTG